MVQLPQQVMFLNGLVLNGLLAQITQAEEEVVDLLYGQQLHLVSKLIVTLV